MVGGGGEGQSYTVRSTRISLYTHVQGTDMENQRRQLKNQPWNIKIFVTATSSVWFARKCWRRRLHKLLIINPRYIVPSPQTTQAKQVPSTSDLALSLPKRNIHCSETQPRPQPMNSWLFKPPTTPWWEATSATPSLDSGQLQAGSPTTPQENQATETNVGAATGPNAPDR